MAKPSKTTAPARRTLIQLLLDIPRLGRIVICTIFALALAVVFFPIVDYVYLLIYYPQSESEYLARNLPGFITVALGLGMYMVGWRYYIGTVQETPPPHRVISWYFGIGFIFVLIASGMAVQGLMWLNGPL